MRIKFKIFFSFLIIIGVALGYYFRNDLVDYFKGLRNTGQLLYYYNGWRKIPDSYYKIINYNGFRSFLDPSQETLYQEAAYSVKLLKLRREGGVAPFNVYFFTFDPKFFHFRVNVKFQRDFINNFIDGNQIFGVNASFFDKSGKILGLVISNGRLINSIGGKRNSHFVVYKDRTTPEINSREDFILNINKVLDAVRGYPLIMTDGIVNESIIIDNERNKKISRRTVVAKLLNGNIAFLVTDTLLTGLSLKEIPVIVGGLGARDALNLDGGGSTQSIFKTSNFNLEISGTDKIPVGLGIYPK